MSESVIDAAPLIPKAKRILVVDNQPDTLRRIKLYLERNSHLIETAKSGAQALVQIEANRPDLLITDVFMPEMDGYELMEAVRCNIAPTELPVLLFGFADANDGNILPIPYPPDRVILKPRNLAQLADLVSIVTEMLRGSDVDKITEL